MSFPSELYDGSFGGTGFWEQFQGLFGVGPDSGVEYATTKIPGGSKVVVDSAGPGPRVLKLRVAVASAELATLRTKADSATRASLIYHNGTVNARLMKVTDVLNESGGAAHLCTLELIIG